MKRLMALMASVFFVFALSACGGGGGGGDGDNNENSAPIANAGADQNISTGSTVTLSGGGSDADGDLLSYSWELTSKPPLSTATLSDSTLANPTFIAEVDGAYVLTLTVNDGKEISNPSTVTIAASVSHDYTNLTDYTKLSGTLVAAVNLMNSQLLATPAYLDDLLSKNTAIYDLPVQNYFGSETTNDVARAQFTVSTIKADFPVQATADMKPYRLRYEEFDNDGVVLNTLRIGSIYGCSNSNDINNPTAECVQYSYESISNNAIQFSASGSVSLVKTTTNGLVYLSPLL